MTAREAYARIVYEDPAMLDLGFLPERVWQANALDSPNTENIFIVIASEGKEKAFGNVGVDLVSYWVHAPRARTRDYVIIDMALDRIEEILVSVEHFAGSDGYVLSSASWVDRSRDLTDDAYNTLTKFSTFRAATRSVVTT